jgi:murein DD-endopeptidase MepM/ murein hydrolase activator NlpD
LYGNKNAAEVIFNSHGFIWPTSSHKISNGGYFHDANYFKGRVHTGLDISTPMGSPVRATADGEVSAISYIDHCTTIGNDTKCPLNFISIVHEKPNSSRYLHLSKIFVNVGDPIEQGDVIGLSGGAPGTIGSGTEVIGGAVYGYGGAYSTGAHLHFEIRSGGLPDDPLKYLP